MYMRGRPREPWDGNWTEDRWFEIEKLFIDAQANVWTPPRLPTPSAAPVEIPP